MRLILIILVIFAAIFAYIRFAFSDPARWHMTLDPRPDALGAPNSTGVTVLAGAAYTDLPLAPEIMAQLKSIALATPRTTILAEDGDHITFVTRSKIFGFPDYTTAQITSSGLTLYARLRFGTGDGGVNAARLTEWRKLLAP